MLEKEINIPKFLHGLHGERTTILNLLCVYIAASLVGILIILNISGLDLPLWKTILIFALYFDIAGGVVANLSISTNQYYQRKSKGRILFIISHFVHPVLFIFLFPGNVDYYVFVGSYTIFAALIVNSLKTIENQQNLAYLFVTTGIVISLLFDLPLGTLYLFAPLFMIKLIFGFSVRRPAFTK